MTMELLPILLVVILILSLAWNTVLTVILARHFIKSKNAKATEAWTDGFKAGAEQSIGLAVQMPEAFQGKGMVSIHDLEVVIREFRRKIGKLVDSIGG